MEFETDLFKYFKNFVRGYQLEKRNPGLLDTLMTGVKGKHISTHGLKDGLEYRKKIQQMCKDQGENDITV